MFFYSSPLLLFFISCVHEKGRKVQGDWLFDQFSGLVFDKMFQIKPHEKPCDVVLDRVDTISLTYVLWGCYCPKWVPIDSTVEINDSNAIFIVPQMSFKKVFPDSLMCNENEITFIGSFYKDEQCFAVDDGGCATTFSYYSFVISKVVCWETESTIIFASE